MMVKVNFKACCATLLLTLASFQMAEACTRVLYTGADDVVLTGRSMDWSEDMHSNLWVFPRGMQRDGASGTRSLTWKSKYGSLIASCYEAGTAEGINEKGLVANLLYLVESDYGNPIANKPVISAAVWAQYVLDNFATVAEAVEVLKKELFTVLGPVLPNNAPTNVHLSVSDPTGDSAIFEYLKGKLVIHHGKEYTVMTNSPSYDQQLALDAYWQDIGGLTFLPGTNRAADRFARASFLLGAIPKKADPHYITAVPDGAFIYQAVASVLGVVRSVSVPLGITTPKEPNIASTLWRSVSDQKNKIYYFDSATTPNTFWVLLPNFDLKEGSPVMKLTVAGGKVYSGEASKSFVEAKPFKFLPVQAK